MARSAELAASAEAAKRTNVRAIKGVELKLQELRADAKAATPAANNNAVVAYNKYKSSESELESNAYPIKDDVDANEPIVPNANEFKDEKFSREE
ncbi:hypothetical protein VF21_04205 [Pseudogymnoascus sp. 05NY08]|nr:hypothetical protein VF21_04205 [Pseudogymnoascus sp. 05NY08]